MIKKKKNHHILNIVNRFYGREMLQNLTVNGFNWVIEIF